MAEQFLIKKGQSVNLFDDNGNPKIELIENCWYLTLDTAEVFVALKDPETLALKLNKINDFENDPEVDSFDPKVYFYATFEDLPTAGVQTDCLYVVNSEDATYRWNGTKFVCVGRDYKEITLICGGDADPSND